MKKNLWIFLLPLVILGYSCSQDDDVDLDEVEEVQVIPQIAIIGTDLTNGDSPNLLSWSEDYEVSQTDFLPDLLSYDFGRLKNTIDGKISVGVGFPVTEFIRYDIENESIERFTDFFTPENEVSNSFVLNTASNIVTYYLDMGTACCDVYLNSYDIARGTDTEFFLGNLDVVPVQLNTFTKGNKSFVTGVDTFTGVKKLFVHNLDTNTSLGILDVDAYGGFFYNTELEQVYLFDFSGSTLTYDILDLNFFTISESASFIRGVTAESGFNDVRFEDNKMIFKQNFTPQSSVPLDAIYDFATTSLQSFDSTDLINAIFEQTGIGIGILDTEVDLTNNVYIVSGSYVEEGVTKGLVVFMTLDKEVLLSVDTDITFPEEIILLN